MHSRKDFFGGNWKMYKNLNEARNFFKDAQNFHWSSERETVFFPPFHLLLPLKEQFSPPFVLGAQNFHPESTGAYTGEVSAWMLNEENIGYALIGHSERREYFHEGSPFLKSKLEAGLSIGLRVIFCVGETLAQRKAGIYRETVQKQLEEVLKGLTLLNHEALIIAYEPVWAIGTGETASPDQAQEMHAFIREELARLKLPASHIRIIYGGSVKPDNCQSLMNQQDIDGALVGSASLKAADFHQIVHYDA